ncbi:MAG: DUF3861 domain-containing protein [Janthinobacterium lividum]
MPHSYRVIVQRLSDITLDDEARKLTFDVTNHDEIIQLVERVKSRGIVPNEEATAFTIGMKLFGEVMLRHRHETLFAELFPHFGAFMKRLKEDASQASEQ